LSFQWEVYHDGVLQSVKSQSKSVTKFFLNKISEALDAQDVLGEKPYTLEVGSPGIDKALTHARHWRRNNGRLVKINFGSNSEVGRIVESDDEKVSIEVKGKTRSILFDKIDKAFIQVEFNPKKSSK
jgi:ribosome maturation factor RimP